jgi:sigma-E factor negative regulatory protein RseA
MDERLFEKLSALADGELPLSDAELAFAALDSPEGWTAWNAYHQIGHTLRSDHFGADLRPGFHARLAQRLAAEAADAPPSGTAGASGATASSGAATISGATTASGAATATATATDPTLLPAAAASADSGLP